MVKPKLMATGTIFKEKSGIMATGWSKHNNHTYYYQLNGWMTYGEKKIDGKWYYFHERTGVMATGWSKHMAIHIIINLMVR